MSSYHNLNLSLVDGMNDGLIPQVGVESYHREGLFETRLSGNHPLSLCVCENTDILFVQLAQLSQTLPKICGLFTNPHR